MKVLGLDISTTTIGICIIDFCLDGKAKLIHIEYYKPVKNTIEDKNYDFLITLSEAKKHILKIIKEYKPDHIAIEDYIRFLKGGSGSSTILPLSQLNRIICLACYEAHKLTPLHICNVISIRTRIKKDILREDLPPKEELPEIMEKLLNITIPRPIKKTRKGEKIADEHFDMADAVCVAYFIYRKLQEENKCI